MKLLVNPLSSYDINPRYNCLGFGMAVRTENVRIYQTLQYAEEFLQLDYTFLTREMFLVIPNTFVLKR